MRASYAQILEALKCSGGLPVSDLARELQMSYMGVKQHCLKLVEMGYLEEWRVPREKKEVGRPEKLYRLTKRCDPLFPEAGVSMTLAVLDGVKEIYGDAAPEKLLFHHFEKLRGLWLPKLKSGKSLVEKATRFTDLRAKAGWFNRCHYDSETGFRIEEFHSPLAKVYTVYQNAIRMEVEMMEHVLGTKVVRKEASMGKGRKMVVYEIATLGVVGPSAQAEKSGVKAPNAGEDRQGELF